MKFEDVRHLVLRGLGEYSDEYYKEFHELEEDMDFFNLYLQRNKKCDTFHYTIIPCENFVAFPAFIDIYKQYGYGYLEETYTIFKALKLIVLDVYNETNKFTPDEIRNFVDYFKKELELDVVHYVYCFVGCSHGTAATVAKIQSIIEGDDENGTDQQGES